MYQDATTTQIDEAMQRAHAAFLVYRHKSGKQKATFIRAIADEIEALGEAVIKVAMRETHLPAARLLSERGRTCFQLRNIADVVAEGSWVEATIETSIPERQPLPKPDIRNLLVPIGPVVVFGASNFPFAYSTAGVDPAAAWAAGCPVVLKAHPAHPETSEMVAGAILKAVEKTGMPSGVFEHIHGANFEVGKVLVMHPKTAAVGFTGSFGGGKALFDLANQRPVPIPVFAEMGSTNPVFLLPDALEKEAEKGGWWASCSKKKVSVPDVPFAKAKAYLMTILPSYQVRPENEYGFGANTDMYAVEDTTSSATIQEVIAYFSQPSPSDFDKRLMKLASVTQNDLYVLLGRRALAEHNYTQAAEAFGKVPDDFWEKEPFATYFNGNPFYLEPDEERNAEPVYTPATFAKRMAELQTKVKEDPSDAEAWYLLGCGAYNLSYFGSAWILVTRQWSSVELDYSSIENKNNDYYNPNGARKYFDQAMKMAANNSEMAAKACFMASKCEQNAFFAYRGDETNRRYAKGNYDDNSAEMEKLRRQKYMTFFQLLKTRYRGTKFHKEILEECGDYADFVSSK